MFNDTDTGVVIEAAVAPAGYRVANGLFDWFREPHRIVYTDRCGD